MAVYCVEGKIGSGKTYYCVYSLLAKYYMYDEVLGEYVQKKNTLVVSNIDDLKAEHIDLKKCIEDKSVSAVFSEDFIKDLRSTYKCCHIIFIIDEAQRMFDRKFYDKDVFFFFQYSRHYGVDLYLICPDSNDLPRQISSLCEYFIRAVSRSQGSGIGFHYRKRVGDEPVGNINLRKKKQIFQFYRSQKFEELDKPKPVMYKYLALGIILMVVAGVLFKYVFIGFFRGELIGRAGRGSQGTSQVLPGPVGNHKKYSPDVVEYRDLKKMSYEKKMIVEEKTIPDSVPSVESCELISKVVVDGVILTSERCGDNIVRKKGGVVSSIKKDAGRGVGTPHAPVGTPASEDITENGTAPDDKQL